MDAVSPYLPRFWDGFLVTIEVTLISVALAIPFALLLGGGRAASSRIVRLVAGTIVEFFRGTSVIVQLFWAFYALPLILGVQIEPLVAAVAVLALNEGSYAADAMRGAINAVPRGQTDAAVALNLSPWRRFRSVILPQALPRMIPPLGNMAVDTAKGSAIVGYVTVTDLTYWGEQARTATGESLVIYVVVLAMYFAFAVCLAAIFRGLEQLTPTRRIARRVRRNGRRRSESGSASTTGGTR